MLSVKARETADTIFELFGMTQLRIKHSRPCFAANVLITNLLVIDQHGIKVAYLVETWNTNTVINE